MSTLNPFKKTAAAPLVDQLDVKLNELEDIAADKAAEATSLAQLAAEATSASNTAARQSIAVNQARVILLDAGVTL